VPTPDISQLVRVVLVSPSDVPEERSRVQRVVEELNRHLARVLGFRLSLFRWEDDAAPGLHLEGPQGLLDSAMDIPGADVVIGIFWGRFGTPVADARSGTAHELNRAWEAWRETGHPDVMLYFCERDVRTSTAADAEQLRQLLEFREALPNEQMYGTYGSVEDFESALRDDLSIFLIRLAETAQVSGGDEPEASMEEETGEPIPAEGGEGLPKLEVFRVTGAADQARQIALAFEDHVKRMFLRDGWNLVEQPRSYDYGFDFSATRGGETAMVEVSLRYRFTASDAHRVVGAAALRDLVDVDPPRTRYVLVVNRGAISATAYEVLQRVVRITVLEVDVEGW